MSTATIIRTDANATDLLKESQSRSFEALPAGRYEGTVAKVEVVDFAKSGRYHDGGFKALNVQLRVIDGAPVGAGRVFFLRVPLFQRFLPTEKNPKGAVAQTYFDFFLHMGFSAEDVAGGKVPLDQASLGGKRIGFTLKVNPADEYNSEPYNEVTYVNAPKDLPGAPAQGASAVGNAFAPKVEDSPWGSPAPASDEQLQAAAEGKGAF